MKKRIFSLLLLTVFLMAGCSQAAESSESVSIPDSDPGTFTLTFITIGKGDAFLLTAPDGSHYLVDTGKAEDYPQIARTLRVRDIDALDGIFLTHGHKDHAGNLDALLGAFPTKAVYIFGKDTVSYTKIQPREIAAAHQTELVELSGGEVLELGGAAARIWLPDQVDFQNANNNSLVMRITHSSSSFLLMGDAELEEETLLMSSGFPLQSDLLKLGHHGETDATSPAFLKKVSPSIALITGNAEENPDSVNKTISEELESQQIQAFYSEGDFLALDFISDGNQLITQPVKDRELASSLRISFDEINRKEQWVRIRNDADKTADLSGCLLISQRGDEHFLFPAGTHLEPGQYLTISCIDSSAEGDLIWAVPDVWRKKRDTALLYDSNLNLLDSDPA